MKENIKNKPILNAGQTNARKDFSKPTVDLSNRKEGPAVKPQGYVNPAKSTEFKHGINKPLDKSNCNDCKKPKGGCGCS
ncbi:MAG: hypothetical protein V4489_04025 [Chlamydiota bacterium]